MVISTYALWGPNFGLNLLWGYLILCIFFIIWFLNNFAVLGATYIIHGYMRSHALLQGNAKTTCYMHFDCLCFCYWRSVTSGLLNYWIKSKNVSEDRYKREQMWVKTNVRESKCKAPHSPSNAVETQIETDKASWERNPPASDVTQHSHHIYLVLHCIVIVIRVDVIFPFISIPSAHNIHRLTN